MSTISRDNYMPADRVITIAALDTREDWFGDYVSAVERASGLDYTHDDSEYGVFADEAGTRYQAYVRPDLSDDETWTVDLDVIE